MRQISPGQEGHIEVKVKTGGNGGRKIRENVQIKTNDPKLPIIEISVTGMVEAFVTINPPRISFMGMAGEPLVAEVEIVPRKEYPFNITEVTTHRGGDFIKYEFKEKCTKQASRCVLRVENIKTDKGRYTEVIMLHTDHPQRPVISIAVSGTIQ